MVAVLSRKFGIHNLDLCMDVVQDTFETALIKWKFSGVPDNPEGWLMRVSLNKAINALKKTRKTTGLTAHNMSEELYEESKEAPFFDSSATDESLLQMLFACCSSHLSEKNQIIATLYILCGFGVPEIARALYMKKEAVKKAISRSKSILSTLDQKRIFNVRFYDHQKADTVLTVLYLMFNEGYKTTRSDTLINNELCFEAIRLAKILYENKDINNRKVQALLALMFFTISRFPGRMNSEGDMLSLEDQDRKKWDRRFINEGFLYLREATSGNAVSRYHLEAIISSLHSSSHTFEETDWDKIVFLYDQLANMETNNPGILINAVIAKSYIHTSTALIHEIDRVAKHYQMFNHFIIPAVKGHLFYRLEKYSLARSEYKKALELSSHPLDRAFFANKIAICKK